MRLITRDDASLGVALIAASVILFQQPLRDWLDFVQAIEARYRVDLMPALILLIVVFIFHEHRKRLQVRAAAAAAELDASHARHELRSLQQLIDLGQGLAHAHDLPSFQQAIWKHVPSMLDDRPFWVLLRGQTWEVVVHDTTKDARSQEALIEIAQQVLGRAPERAASCEACGGDECVALVADDDIVGVFGVRGPLSPQQQKMVSAAAATIAISIRNIQLLCDTREQSVRDELTGCSNRAYGLEALSLELRRARRTGLPLSVLMFDLDDFKAVNDCFGHVRGDALLAGVGARLRQMLRSTDVRCRYGGDEFLIILSDTPVSGAHHVAEWIRREVSELGIEANGHPVPATASIGIATAVPGESDAIALVARADAALYEAKRTGRNRVVIAPPPAPAAFPADSPPMRLAV